MLNIICGFNTSKFKIDLQECCYEGWICWEAEGEKRLMKVRCREWGRIVGEVTLWMELRLK